MDNAYNIPNLHGRGAACRTNLPSNTAFRGFGVPQSIMIVENMINDVALLLGRPADEVHIINIKTREPDPSFCSRKSSGRPLRRTTGQPRGNSGKPSGTSGGGSSPPPTLFTVEVGGC